MSIPSAEPFYVTSLEGLFWGGTLVVIIMVMHGLSMIAVVRANDAVKRLVKAENQPHGRVVPCDSGQRDVDAKNSWVADPMIKILQEFEARLKKYPTIRVGTPDPYVPPK
jgi:hypothetical protein